MKSEGMTQTVPFTPGPWHAYPNPMRDDGWFVSTVELKDTSAVKMRPDGDWETYRVPKQNITFFQINKEANARLIAAAPDMHEAWRLLIDFADNAAVEITPALAARIDLGRAALAKTQSEGTPHGVTAGTE